MDLRQIYVLNTWLEQSQSNTVAPCSHLTFFPIYRLRFAASIVCAINIVIVIGPTPFGTGVI